MKLLLPIFSICLMVASCSNKNKAITPVGVLGRDTMASVIADVHLVQASQRMGMVLDTTDTCAFTSTEYVWKKHHITEAEYEKSLDYYSHNTGILDSIYEKVLTNLNRQKAELSGKQPLK
jgi:hypothetical protein